MTPVKILIVEDEMIIATRISVHLEELGYEVSGIIPRGKEALAHCRETPPDILLLDINLKGQMDGIETAKALQEEMDLPIVYLTANSDDATFQRAKTTHPEAFIAKPYNRRDLERTLELVIDRLHQQEGSSLTGQAHEEKMPSYILNDRIFVRDKDRMVKLFLKEILYIEAERSYCRITTEGEEYLLSIPLKNLEDKLTDSQFFRIHRSFLINLEQMDEIAENHVVIRKKAIPIGKSYKESFGLRIRKV